jgi:hypothetical protein
MIGICVLSLAFRMSSRYPSGPTLYPYIIREIAERFRITVRAVC